MRKRLVYWKWSPNGFATDIISSSLDGMLLLLLEAHGFSSPEDPFLFPTAFRRMNSDCVVPFVASTHADQDECPRAFTGFQDTMHANVLSVLKSCPSQCFAGTARPFRYADYAALAAKCNYIYKGCSR